MELDSSFHHAGWEIKYTVRGGAVDKQLNSSTSWKATPIVFVHGTPWSSIVYKPLIEALEARGAHRILAYDLPGYGESQTYKKPSSSLASDSDDEFEGDTSVKFQADALSALLKHTALDGRSQHPSPAVIAHDIAGAIVLRAHLMHNCDFASMMLLDTNAVLPWGDGFYKIVRSDYGTFLKLPSGTYEAVVRSVIQSACHNVNVLKAGWEDELARPWTADLSSNGSSSEHEPPTPCQRSFVRQIAQANDKDVEEMLQGNLYSGLRCNVKILWGEEDKWIPREKLEELARRIGSSRVKEMVAVPRAGHLVMLDQPERVAIEVFDWLSSGSML